MDDKKQIEQLEIDLSKSIVVTPTYKILDKPKTAKKLYTLGYRKESETVGKILTYLYEKMGNSALSDTELVKNLAVEYGVQLDDTQ